MTNLNENLRADARSAAADNNGYFAYTQTRVQGVNDKLLKENRVISILQPGQWLESYRMLRTRCLHAMDNKGWQTLAITGAGAGSGASLTAVNLSISIAMELDRTALLVDANFKNPAVHKLFGFEPELGLSDHLLHGAQLTDMLVNPGIDRLVVLPAGKPMLNSTEMLHSPKMLHLVRELKNRYPSRIIIFDMPPLVSQDDALGFSPLVDAVLLVVDEGQTKIKQLKHAASLLKNVDVLGSVLNKASDNSIAYSE